MKYGAFIALCALTGTALAQPAAGIPASMPQVEPNGTWPPPGMQMPEQQAPQENTPTRATFVSTGELEGLADENRALAEFLRERGADVLFKSAWDGHHWHNWRDQLRDGLTWVLRPGG